MVRVVVITITTTTATTLTGYQAKFPVVRFKYISARCVSLPGWKTKILFGDKLTLFLSIMTLLQTDCCVRAGPDWILWL